MSETSSTDSPAEKPTAFEFPRWTLDVLAIGIPALVFLLLPPLWKSGLWDPYELNIADLGRRMAANQFDAGALNLTGADNSLPHLNDLGRPQLPFTSIALGFKLFGLHEWSGRLPLALWGLIGVVSLYFAIARLVDKRAALYAALALSTMPLYFVQARTMLGDIVTMSGVAMAFAGFSVLVFDRFSIPFLLMGLIGVVVGYESRGALLGVAVPLGGVGIAWAVTFAAGQYRSRGLSDVMGGAALVVALVMVALCVVALQRGDQKNLSIAVGAMIRPPAKYPTFDFVIGHLGHALAPWSAFIPFALGRLFIAPNGDEEGQRKESQFRLAILVTAAVAFSAHAFLAQKTELIAFCGPAIFAAGCGLAIRDFERGAHASLALGVGTAVFLGVFHHDFHEIPD